MQPIYCYSFRPETGVSVRAAPPDYVPENGERISSPEPATVEQIAAWFPQAADTAARALADIERRRRVNAAYGSQEKRSSAIGYATRLAGKATLGGLLSDEQKADLAVLIEADEWEDRMIAARNATTADNPTDWPDPPPGLTAEFMKDF